MGGKGRGKRKKRKKGVKEGKEEGEGGGREGGEFCVMAFGGDGYPWCERLRLVAYLLDH